MAECLVYCGDCDRTFARMLALELEFAGITTESVTAFPDDTGGYLLSVIVSASQSEIKKIRAEAVKKGIACIGAGKCDEAPEFADFVYFRRPFEIEAFISEAKNKIEEAQSSDHKIKKGLYIDRQHKKVTYCGYIIDLSNREYQLLEYLWNNKNQTVTREELRKEVWSDENTDTEGGTNNTDVYISYLRAKLDERFGRKIIVTVRGKGYKICDEGEK